MSPVLEDRLAFSTVLLCDWLPILGLTWMALRRRRRWWLFAVCAYLIIGAAYATYGTAVTMMPAGVTDSPERWSFEQGAGLFALVLAATVAWPLFMALSPFV